MAFKRYKRKHILSGRTAGEEIIELFSLKQRKIRISNIRLIVVKCVLTLGKQIGNEKIQVIEYFKLFRFDYRKYYQKTEKNVFW